MNVFQFEDILNNLEKESHKLSLGECRELSKVISKIWVHAPQEVMARLNGYLTAENEYVRIIAIYGLKEIISTDNGYFDQLFQFLLKMADDWSGRVKSYGLIPVFAELWESFPTQLQNVLLKTEVTDNYSLLIILLRSLTQFLTTKNNRANNLALEQLFFEQIEKHITFDEPYFMSGLISLINHYGSKFPQCITPFLQKWAAFKNTQSHYIITEALSKKLGKVLSESQIHSLQKSMSEVQTALLKVQTQVVLERKYHVVYLERSVQTLLHWINVFFLPFKYGANPYRGCEHGCLYCNARHTHEYLGKDETTFHNGIIVKVNAHKALARDFSTPRWKKTKAKLVNLGSVSDPYQPAEKIYGITRKLLEIFLQYENPVCISTKSTLILRDLDLLTELHDKHLVNVMITIPTLNEPLLQQLEANKPSPLERLDTIKKLKDHSLTVGALIIPIFPYLTDNLADIELLLKHLAAAHADFAIVDVLNFKNHVQPRFTYFLQQHYPALVAKYDQLYSYGKRQEYAEKAYLKRIIPPVMNNLLKHYDLHHFERMLKGKFDP